MSSEHDERLHSELTLLKAMYPDQIAYDQHASELKYTTVHDSFTLRVPERYLEDELPEVLAAIVNRTDAREHLRHDINTLPVGEEVLDSIVIAFENAVEGLKLLAAREARQRAEKDGSSVPKNSGDCPSTAQATVVVWLHHLLNTNKRKQALSPPSSEVSGVTKPGYPGVLIYSGPSDAVHEHVNELKSLNWQAFQVRLESDEEWTFVHGKGVKEVEAMKDIVTEIGEGGKEAFLDAMRMR